MFDGRVNHAPVGLLRDSLYATHIAFSIASTWQRERSTIFALMFGISIPLLSAWVILRRTLCTVAARCCRHQFTLPGVVILRPSRLYRADRPGDRRRRPIPFYPRHSMLTALTSQVLELANYRLEHLAGAQQPFSFPSVLALFRRPRQLSSHLLGRTRRRHGHTRRVRSPLLVRALLADIIALRADDRRQFSPPANPGSNCAQPPSPRPAPASTQPG